MGEKRAEGTTPETTEEPNLNPVKLPHELWTAGIPTAHNSTLRVHLLKSPITLVLAPAIPYLTIMDSLGAREFVRVSACLPALAG